VSSLATSAPTFINCRHDTTSLDKGVLTILKVLGIIVLEHLFGIVSHERGRVF
jgi:hypothetical protein